MKTYKIITTIGKNTTILPENTPIEVTLTEQEVKELVNEYMMNNGGAKPTHKRKYFVPKVGENYYSIDFESIAYNIDDNISSCVAMDENLTKYRASVGNCFATEQDAQDELNRRQALVRIWNNYDDKYSWEIDWNINTLKYKIYYDHSEDEFSTSNNSNSYMQYSTELPYFKSAEDRNQFVEDNRDDLLVVFNIKK